MARLAIQLKDQLEDSARLEAQIKANFGGWVMRSNITYTLDEIAEIYDGPHATPKKLETGDAIF